MDTLRAEQPKEYGIFRVYHENHPESQDFKPPEVIVKDEIDFTPKFQLELRSEDSQLIDPTFGSVVTRLGNEAIMNQSTEDIMLITDVNDLLRANDYLGAEYLLGRSLTKDEILEQQVRELRQAKGSTDQLNAELNREEKKEAMKQARSKRAAELAALKNPGLLVPNAPPLVGNYAPGGMVYNGRVVPMPVAPLVPLAPPLVPLAPPFVPFVPAPPRPALAPIATVSPPSPVQTRPSSPTGSVSSVSSSLSVATQAIMNRLVDLGVVPVDLDDALRENDILFAKRMAALGVTSTQMVPITLEREQARADLGLSATPAASPTVKSPTVKSPKVLDFTFEDAGKTFVFNPNVSKPKIEIMKMIKEQMLNQYPHLAATFKQWTSKTTAGDMHKMLVDANAQIVAKKIQKGKGINGDDDEESGSRGNPYNLFTLPRKAPEHWVPFGPRFHINTKKLNEDNTFSLVFPKSGQKPPTLRNTILSPGLKSCIKAFIDGDSMNTMDLTEKEQDWLKFVWKETKLAVPKPGELKMPMKRYLTKKGTRERMKVLMGEIMSGNDGGETLMELKKHVAAMAGKRYLSDDELTNALNFIKNCED